jgi:sugar phosphate isomerase/epimerase
MILTGLVSITFRHLAAREIVRLVSSAGLEGIEWGGDIHVPHGQLETAREVRRMTEEAGLRVASYGSYYHVGAENDVSFESVLVTAAELGGPTVRVWAGNRSSAEADEDYWNWMIEESRRIAERAEQTGIAVAYEFHSGTLTDTAASARRLLEEVNHPNLKTYWQPTVGMAAEECRKSLEMVLPWVTNVHVFHWGKTSNLRYPLAEGAAGWDRYLELITPMAGEHYAMIEFVKEDSPETFMKDARTLREWVERRKI